MLAACMVITALADDTARVRRFHADLRSAGQQIVPNTTWDSISSFTWIGNWDGLDPALLRPGRLNRSLYLGFPSSSDAFEPVQQLKGFSKVTLAPGKSGTVSFKLTSRELSTWDTTSRAWSAAKGTFTVSVGTSSRDENALTTTFKN